MKNRTLSALTGGEKTTSDARKSSLAFKDISALTIAEQLTYLECRMLRRIPVSSSFLNVLRECCELFTSLPKSVSITSASN